MLVGFKCCERRSAKIYELKRTVNLFYLLATAATGQVTFRGYARLVKLRQLYATIALITGFIQYAAPGRRHDGNAAVF